MKSLTYENPNVSLTGKNIWKIGGAYFYLYLFIFWLENDSKFPLFDPIIGVLCVSKNNWVGP